MKYSVDENSSKKELLNFIRGATRSELISVCTIVGNQTDSALPTNGTKDQIISALSSVDQEDLWSAIEVVFPDEKEDDRDEDTSEDDVEEYENDDE